MLASETKQLNKIIDNVIYTPIYQVDQYKPVFNSEGAIIDHELIGFKILKTAEENYKDSLKESLSEPSEGEVLMSNVILENAILKQQMVEQQELTANLLLQIAELKGGNANV